MPQIITSRDNALLRLARAVRDGKEPQRIYVEGLRLCEEALQSGLSIHAVIFSDELAQKQKAAKLIRELESVCEKVASVSERLLESISFTKTPQGIVLLASRPDTSEDRLASAQKGSALLVVMHRVNNPVNVGAILRTAEAAGATGAIATANTSDPFSPKSLRGAMGSAFRLPVWHGPTYEQTLAWCSKRGIVTICADAHASLNYEKIDWKQACALILGPESSGLSMEETAAADSTVSIPLQPPVDSLNVAVAAGVLLYEAARQRKER